MEPPRTIVKTEWRFNECSEEEEEAAASTVDDSSVMEGSDDDDVDENEMWGDDDDAAGTLMTQSHPDAGESSCQGEAAMEEDASGHTESEFEEAVSVFPGLDW